MQSTNQNTESALWEAYRIAILRHQREQSGESMLAMLERRYAFEEEFLGGVA